MALAHRWNKLLFLREIMLKNNFEIINSFFFFIVRPRTFQSTFAGIV